MKKILVFFSVLLFSATSVYADLHDRGGGLIYDDVLNVTWLQDANFAQTSGYDADGRMNWSEAMEWADQLIYAGYDDWKLPQTLPINGSEYVFGAFNPDGSKDRGYNVSAPGSVYSGSMASQLAFMYYNNLENLARVDIYGDYPQNNWGLKNTAPFINIQSVESIGYWSYSDDPHLVAAAFTFDFYDGWQFSYYKDVSTLYAWPVRDGDVSPQPLLFGCDYRNGLIKIIPSTAGYLMVINSERPFEAMAFDSNNGVLYAIENLSGDNLLVSIDYSNKTITNIGYVNGYTEITSMTYDRTTDTLYAIDQTTRTLLKIDPTNGYR